MCACVCECACMCLCVCFQLFESRMSSACLTLNNVFLDLHVLLNFYELISYSLKLELKI